MKAHTQQEALTELFEVYSILNKLGYTVYRDQIQELIADLPKIYGTAEQSK